jgi:hypothetical protein
MRRCWRTLVVAVVALEPSAALAADDDVDRIPSGVLDEPKTPKQAMDSPSRVDPRVPFRGKLFLEDAFTAWSAPSDVPVPYPSSLVIDWQNRSSFDASFKWKPRNPLAITLSDRVNVFEQSNDAFMSSDTIRNDFREGYVTWEPTSNTYLEAGRINVRGGVALGFNPTDFFKTRTLVGQSSLDPSVIRQNRLGTLMVRGQKIWDVAGPAPVAESSPIGVDPHFDATNAAYRLLCTLHVDIEDLSPEVLGYFELHRSKVGLSVSHPIGDAVVAYAEWAGGPETNLITRAIALGQATGTLPANAPVVPATDTSSAFRNDVAAGFSWTIATEITLNAEYHFHEAGFTHRDWQNWFDRGGTPGAPSTLANELWFLRGYANDQQEPVSQHQVFVRASWPRALASELELSAFAFVDPLDGSVLTQVSASYYLSDAWTASAFLSANLGDARSERGSVPQRVSTIFQVTRYL